MKRILPFIIGLVALLPFAAMAMKSPVQSSKLTHVQSPTVTRMHMLRPAAVIATAAIPTPTEVVPTTTNAPNYEVQIFYYSYYNPDLLAPSDIVNGVCANQEGGICHTVNCWEYAVADEKCKSSMASGLDWHAYVGHTVACGFEYPLGTEFHVLEPEILAGEYICLDRCPACTGKRQLDFLSLIQLLPWNQKLLVQVTIN